VTHRGLGGVRSQSYPLGECGENDHRSPPGSPRVNFYPAPSLLSAPAGSNVTDNWLDVSLLAARSSGRMEEDDTRPSGGQAESRRGIRFSKPFSTSPSRNTDCSSLEDEAIRTAVGPNVGLPNWLLLLFNRRRPHKKAKNVFAAPPPETSEGVTASDAVITAFDDAQVAGQRTSLATHTRLDLEQQQRPRRSSSAPDMPIQDSSAATDTVGAVDGPSDDNTTTSHVMLLDQRLTSVVNEKDSEYVLALHRSLATSVRCPCPAYDSARHTSDPCALFERT
jgi:hypothetical protein